MIEKSYAEPDGDVVLARSDDGDADLEVVWSGSLERIGACLSLSSFPSAPEPAETRKPVENKKTTRQALSSSSWAEQSLRPMGQPPRDRGPIEFPRGPSGAWIGSVHRLPQGLDLRRSPSRRRSAPSASGSLVRQTPATERISPTLPAARTPRRSGPSYSRRWPRRSGAFQSSHRREPVRQTIANLRGMPLRPSGFPTRSCGSLFHRLRMSWVQALSACERPQPPARHSALPTLQLSQPSGSRFYCLREKTTGGSGSNRRKNFADRNGGSLSLRGGSRGAMTCATAYSRDVETSSSRAAVLSIHVDVSSNAAVATFVGMTIVGTWCVSNFSNSPIHGFALYKGRPALPGIGRWLPARSTSIT